MLASSGSGRAAIPIRLHVRRCCPFSAIAEERIRGLCVEDARIQLTARDADEGQHLDDVGVTPVLVLPDGKRLIATPTADRLCRIFEQYVGAVGNGEQGLVSRAQPPLPRRLRPGAVDALVRFALGGTK